MIDLDLNKLFLLLNKNQNRNHSGLKKKEVLLWTEEKESSLKEITYGREYLCMWQKFRVRERVCVYVYVCVCVSERESKIERE